MKYIYVILAMLLVARPITLSLSVINRKSVQKKLGFIFKSISVKGKFVKLFWGRWNRNFFECDGIHEISLMVLLLIPFNLLMYVLVLIYLGMLVIAGMTNNNALLLFACEKYGFHVVMYMVILGILTTVFAHWANIWKRPKVSKAEQKEAMKILNKTLKDLKNQEWYYPLWEELMDVAYASNDEKGEYWFKTSQIPRIKEVVRQSSKNAILNWEYQHNKPNGFVVLDVTNNHIVFQGLLKE